MHCAIGLYIIIIIIYFCADKVTHSPTMTAQLKLVDLLLVFSVAAASLLPTAKCISDRQSFRPESPMKYRYVTPNGTSNTGLPCNGDKPCLTLEEYASDPAHYFNSDTTFYFYPGKHQLNSSLELLDIHHLHFEAVNDGIVSITFDELVGISWINCTDISLSSVNFYVAENFTHLLLFESTSAVSLSNTLITSNTNWVGCSAIEGPRTIVG